MCLDHARSSLPLLMTLGFIVWIPETSHAAPEPQKHVEVLPSYLPQYAVTVHLDVERRLARVRQKATWINPTSTPTDRLIFNAHSRYMVPANQMGFSAKMLEILRVPPRDALGYEEPPCEVERITLLREKGHPQFLSFTYEGDTKTNLVVPLPHAVGPGEAVTVVLEIIFHIPHKMGRWGEWDGVTVLSNWLPVFAYYGQGGFGHKASPPSPHEPASWQPTTFVPWHQPFLNESGIYDVVVTLPTNQTLASSGEILETVTLANNMKQVKIQARGVREFTLITSHRFKVYEGTVAAGPNGRPVKVKIFAFPEHEFYARHMVRICCAALKSYAQWLGPYPWAEFSITECFFGWNGNECSNLVMIDQRVFNMPTVAVGYVEYLVTHEVCHQWWYNLIGTNGYCETWLDEAMANYFSNRLLAERRGKNNALMAYPGGLEWLPNIRRDDFRSSGMYGTFGRGENMAVVQAMPRFGHLANLFNLCYDKGGRIVGMIEDRLGETAFLDFMRGLVRKYRYRILRVADLRRELESYTGPKMRFALAGVEMTWKEFFDRWLYGSGLSDWTVEKVTLTRPAKCLNEPLRCARWRRRLLLARAASSEDELPSIPEGGVRLQVIVSQIAEYDEVTTLGIALEGSEGYPIRIPILPGAQTYKIDEPPAIVTPLPPAKKKGARFQIDVVLPVEPTQVAVDPDQVLVDADPANNYWHQQIRWRITPLYTFLEETDLTNAYDRWNVIVGPWLFSPTYESAWFNRSTMMGVRAGLYRTQQFSGGIYTGYRTNFRDIVSGIDGQWEHWPFAKSQTGFVVERRLREFNNGDQDATRAVLWNRYVFLYGSSLYLPPIHFLEAFAQYSDNFLPNATLSAPRGVRYDRTTTMGLHYRINYLTPYWDPEGGFQLDTWYEGGIAQQPSTVGLHKVAGSFAVVKAPPNLADSAEGLPVLQNVLDWLADTRVAFRGYGATAAPSRGEFFSMGGSELFRGYDLAQRQGSTVWVGSVEWRVPLVRRMNLDAIDHVGSLRNVHAAFFYDIGDAYTTGKSVGPVAHGVGVGLRMDVSWFSFVERTTVRFDIAKAVNSETGVQMWFGLNHPF